jgi:hypothetical protein
VTRASRLRVRPLMAALAAVLAAACAEKNPSGDAGGVPACGAASSSCNSGASCCSGSCLASSCACAAVPGKDCITSLDCCSYAGLACVGHACSTCKSSGQTCDVSDECCLSGTPLGCAAGTCETGCGVGTACTVDNDCCSGYRCRSGSCLPGICSPKYSQCVNASDCCDGGNLSCVGGLCQCKDVGQLCGADSECCAGTVCRTGHCEVP